MPAQPGACGRGVRRASRENKANWADGKVPPAGLCTLRFPCSWVLRLHPSFLLIARKVTCKSNAGGGLRGRDNLGPSVSPVYRQHGALQKIPSVHMLLLAVELKSRNRWFKPVTSVGGFGQPARYAKTNGKKKEKENVCFSAACFGGSGGKLCGEHLMEVLCTSQSLLGSGGGDDEITPRSEMPAGQEVLFWP